MRKEKLKIGFIFLLYSLLVTAVFLAGLSFFIHKLNEPGPFVTEKDEIYFKLDPAAQIKLRQSGIIVTDSEMTASQGELDRAYFTKMETILVPLVIFFCLFLLVISVAFWYILKRFQSEKSRRIAGELLGIAQQEDAPWNLPEDLEPAYDILRKQRSVFFEEYKRLNSYLYHEQKNVIARIRTRMELEENISYLEELDLLTDGIDNVLTLNDSNVDLTCPVDVTAICASVCDTYRKVTDVLTFDFDERDDTIINGKERWITRAVSNLVDNAIKYGEGGPVEVSVKCSRGSVVVTVKDQGPGIPEEEQKRIFDHSYRINALNRDGYGIGLSLVAHVCDLCGGFVTVDSVQGKGSVFYLSFPQEKNLPSTQEEALRKHKVCYTNACKTDESTNIRKKEVLNCMYLFTNALKNIWRNKGRNILIFSIILIMVCSAAISIVINTATSDVIAGYKSKFGSEVTLLRSNKKIEEQNISLSNMKVPVLEDYQRYGESELLKSKEFTANVFVLMEGVKTLDQGKSEGAGAVGEGGSAQGQSGSNFLTRPVGTLIGFSSQEISVEFENGLRKIIEGRSFKEQNECLISQKFAELNHLTVGDKITFSNYSYTGEDTVSQTLTISGIYEDNTPAGNSGVVTSSTNRGNEILTSLETFTSLAMYEKVKQSGLLDIQVSFVLKNPELAEAFQQELYDKGLPAYYTVSADADNYNKVVGPVEGLSRIVTIFLIIVLVLGSLILILLSAMAIRERKYEVGVLRAMGMKKRKVAGGMMTEMLLITAACLVIGLGIGAAASQPVADSLLQSQVQELQSEPVKYNTEEVSSGIRSDQNSIKELEVSLSGRAIGKIAAISLLLALLSSAAGVVFISRYEPVRILSERN